jgi:hypothetical protein
MKPIKKTRKTGLNQYVRMPWLNLKTIKHKSMIKILNKTENQLKINWKIAEKC